MTCGHNFRGAGKITKQKTVQIERSQMQLYDLNIYETQTCLTDQLMQKSAKLYMCVFLTVLFSCLQCFDAVGWAAGRASGL